MGLYGKREFGKRLSRRVTEVSCQLSWESCDVSLSFPITPKLSEEKLMKLRWQERGLVSNSPDELQKLWVYLESHWEKVMFVSLEFGGVFGHRE